MKKMIDILKNKIIRKTNKKRSAYQRRNEANKQIVKELKS